MMIFRDAKLSILAMEHVVPYVVTALSPYAKPLLLLQVSLWRL